MNMNKTMIYQVEKICQDHFSKLADRDFFKRMWQQPQEKYLQRLKQLDFVNKENVLDAGSGFGQWSFALSKLNHNVEGIEYDMNRVNACNELMQELDTKNVNFTNGELENMPYLDNQFDAVFCFGVLMCTDFKKSIKEIRRVLKPGGMFFFNSSDLGWFLYNILENNNSSVDFSPRNWAMESIKHTIDYFSLDVYKKKGNENLISLKT